MKNKFFKIETFSWIREERSFLMAELDAIYAKLYRLTRSELEYFINNFRPMREVELRKFGEFKTKRFVLTAYDNLLLGSE
jgi:hypothetical protein